MFLGDDVEVIVLGLTFSQAMFVEMLLKSRIQCECENKTQLLYMLYTVGACWPSRQQSDEKRKK